jgi:hemin uptake protein HemP
MIQKPNPILPMQPQNFYRNALLQWSGVLDAVIEKVPTYEAFELTKGGKVATITLAGKQYTLRVTKAVKLILTK